MPRTASLLVAVGLLAATAAPAAAAPAPATTAAQHQHRTTGRIVWTSAPDNTFSAGHLVSARPDGSGLRTLTAPRAGVLDIDASTSPDGRRIVYEHIDGAIDQLRIVDADGRHDHALELGCTDPCLLDASPVWQPDGRIAFSRLIGPFDAVNDSAHSVALYTVWPDGSGLRRLSPAGIDGVYEDQYARTAPRGYVIFTRRRNADLAVALFRMDRRGGAVQQLTAYALNAEHFDLSPARYGPTRDLIVFDTFAEGETSLDLATVPATCRSLADCSAQTRFLTDTGENQHRNGNPSFSPDGQRIAFTDRASIADQNADVWTMRYDGTGRRRTSSAPDFDYRPDWGAPARR